MKMGDIGWRTWILIVVLGLSLLAISPSFEKGVLVKSVEPGSDIYSEGLRAGQVIKSVNNQNVETLEEYNSIMNELFLNDGEKRIEIGTEGGSYIVLSEMPLEVSVSDIPKSRIQAGLDLRGGSRALVQADEPLTDNQLAELVEVARNRFNVYGLSDVQIKGVTDLDGNKFMLVEVAGATPEDLEDLIAQQGEFEAKIGNETVFVGGQDKDISDVCRNDATCAYISGCSQGAEGYVCGFAFTIYLTQEAADRHADITRDLELDVGGQYLAESLYLYIDGEEVDSLLISSNLQGQSTTQISIQGSGQGVTLEEANKNAKEEMNKLQTVLITGSLPYQLEIVKLDSISPLLGGDFVKTIIYAGILAILVVSAIVFFRYRRLKASVALLFTAFSELVIILGIAALIGWNLDLASIAGILATIGTGVDQQIVILDEASKNREENISRRLKRALFVIFSAYFTSFFALVPLWWAGAGLFKGFALTTIIGITSGVLITRPAFAEIIRKVEE